MVEELFNMDEKEDRPCPNCGNPVTISVRDLVEGNIITCAICGLRMDTSEVSKGLEQVRQDIEEFKRDLKF